MLFILHTLMLFALMGLPIWVNKIFNLGADAVQLFLIVPVWAIIVVAAADSTAKANRRKHD